MSRTRNKVKIGEYGWPYDKDGRFAGFHKSKGKFWNNLTHRQRRRHDKSELKKDTEDKLFTRFRRNFWYWYW